MRTILLALTMGSILASSPVSAQSTGLFKEYTPLVTPRSDLPIGALWIPSVGPSDGGDPANVSVQQGVSTISLDSTTRQKIGFGLGNFLNLSGGGDVIKSVDIDGIEIHRVADVGKLSITAGQQVLFEGIKARRIALTVGSDKAAEVTANAAAKGIPVVASASAGSAQKITLDGTNLFLAYQVVGFNNPKVKTVRKKHKGSEVTIGDGYRFTFCFCHDNGDADVRVQNLKMPDINGKFPMTKELYPANASWLELSLPRQLSKNRLTAASATVRIRQHKSCFAEETTTGEKLCLVSFPGEANDVTLRTTTFQIERNKKPSATY